MQFTYIKQSPMAYTNVSNSVLQLKRQIVSSVNTTLEHRYLDYIKDLLHAPYKIQQASVGKVFERHLGLLVVG